MKKIISLLLVAILALSLMAGCTGTPDADPTTEPTEVTTEPTTEPTEEPTEAPTEEPTEAPTEEPTTATTEPVAHNWSMNVPEDFIVLADTEVMTMWMAEDLSQATVMVMPYDETILTSTEEEFVAGLATSADEGTVVVNEYTTTEIDGLPTVFADYNCSMNGMAVHCYSYFVLGTETYFFSFYDFTADDARAETFQQMVQSIDILEDTAA